MTAAALTARDLGHAYGDVVALHHLDLQVPPGRIGLVGANGAGKTTLIKILLGILTPTVGAVEVLGADPEEDLVSVRSRIGYMPEGECLPKDQTAADFISYAAELAGVPPANQDSGLPTFSQWSASTRSASATSVTSRRA